MRASTCGEGYLRTRIRAFAFPALPQSISIVHRPGVVFVPTFHRQVGLPVLSAAVATTYEILDRLNLETAAPDAGALLAITDRCGSATA